MAQDPFPGYDGEEPAGSRPPPAGGNGQFSAPGPWPEDRWDGGEESLDALAAKADAGLVEVPGQRHPAPRDRDRRRAAARRSSWPA
jgi:hypothetical protein